ncbi:MAG: adenine deaminase [Bacteroidetes bacterium]|nr:adenine deaminase [Bacteroidota bacterium]
MTVSIEGNIVDVLNQVIYKGIITVEGGIIKSILKQEVTSTNYILPGFIDSHVHIESSMLVPSEFARLAVTHGTVGTISDPHEIGNVLGIDGVKYMLDNGKKTPFKFYFGAPSCVPATTFETAGAVIGVKEIDELLQMPEIVYLAEMMNFPGVLHQDEVVMKKIQLAHQYKKVVDGHAPGLRGEDAKKYISAGITTDHECFTAEEALEKLQLGMKILIREGSAAKNFEALIDLMHDHYPNMMLCSDDKHPNDLVVGHIDQLVKRAIKKGIPAMHVFQAACVNPVKHYGMKVGLLQINDPADFIVADNLSDLTILETYINGELVAKNGKSFIPSVKADIVNNFNCNKISEKDIKVVTDSNKIRVITVEDGQLITKQLLTEITPVNDQLCSDTSKDILKLVVVNRYNDAPPAVAFVKNFGLKEGAMASSVAHDSHNIIATGVSDADIVAAINLLIDHKGGVSAANGVFTGILPLPVAGLMSTEDGYIVAEKYELLDKKIKTWGCTLQSPYMTLSFLALLVIPELKLSDKGLFDGNEFKFTSLFVK